jgi:hypothetical protein
MSLLTFYENSNSRLQAMQASASSVNWVQMWDDMYKRDKAELLKDLKAVKP